MRNGISDHASSRQAACTMQQGIIMAHMGVIYNTLVVPGGAFESAVHSPFARSEDSRRIRGGYASGFVQIRGSDSQGFAVG